MFISFFDTQVADQRSSGELPSPSQTASPLTSKHRPRKGAAGLPPRPPMSPQRPVTSSLNTLGTGHPTHVGGHSKQPASPHQPEPDVSHSQALASGCRQPLTPPQLPSRFSPIRATVSSTAPGLLREGMWLETSPSLMPQPRTPGGRTQLHLQDAHSASGSATGERVPAQPAKASTKEGSSAVLGTSAHGSMGSQACHSSQTGIYNQGHELMAANEPLRSQACSALQASKAASLPHSQQNPTRAIHSQMPPTAGDTGAEYLVEGLELQPQPAISVGEGCYDQAGSQAEEASQWGDTASDSFPRPPKIAASAESCIYPAGHQPARAAGAAPASKSHSAHVGSRRDQAGEPYCPGSSQDDSGSHVDENVASRKRAGVQASQQASSQWPPHGAQASSRLNRQPNVQKAVQRTLQPLLGDWRIVSADSEGVAHDQAHQPISMQGLRPEQQRFALKAGSQSPYKAQGNQQPAPELPADIQNQMLRGQTDGPQIEHQQPAQKLPHSQRPARSGMSASRRHENGHSIQTADAGQRSEDQPSCPDTNPTGEAPLPFADSNDSTRTKPGLRASQTSRDLHGHEDARLGNVVPPMHMDHQAPCREGLAGSLRSSWEMRHPHMSAWTRRKLANGPCPPNAEGLPHAERSGHPADLPQQQRPSDRSELASSNVQTGSRTAPHQADVTSVSSFGIPGSDGYHPEMKAFPVVAAASHKRSNVHAGGDDLKRIRHAPAAAWAMTKRLLKRQQ